MVLLYLVLSETTVYIERLLASSPGFLRGFTENTGGGAARELRACANCTRSEIYYRFTETLVAVLSIIMGVSLVITSANVTEIPYMEVVVSAMFGFRRLFKGSIGIACSLARSMSSWSVENYEMTMFARPSPRRSRCAARIRHLAMEGQLL